MKKFSLILMILLFMGTGYGQTVQELFNRSGTSPKVVRLTPEQVKQITQIAIENTLAQDPDFFFRKPFSSKTSYRIGEQKQFYALNLETNTFYTLTATLKAAGNMSRIWVENASLDSGYVDDAIISQILNRLENNTVAESIDSSKGILEIDTTYFGQPPNIDGDGIVDFLILDIKDGWQPGQGFVAGYFSSNDQNPQNLGSNGMDLLYIDAMPGIYYNGVMSTRTVMGTTAHEFQHLIHYHYDPYEMTFFNEAMSQLAATYCGYGVDDPFRYFNNTNINLISWSSTLADYSRANLFSLYLVEQFGVDFIKNFVQSSLQGPTAINDILGTMGYTERFGDVYKNFLICNIVNDTTTDSRYGYKHPDMQGIHAFSENLVSFPTTKSGSIVQYGALYFSIRNGENLSIAPTLNNAYGQFIKLNQNLEVVDLMDGQTYADSTFGKDYKEGFIIVGNLNADDNYSLDINATMRIGIVELKYDDGTPDQFGNGFTFLTLGDSAKDYGWLVKYVMPKNTENFLYGFSVLVGSLDDTSQGAAQIRVFSSKNGKPFEDIMTPLDVTFKQGWNDINLAELGVVLPDTFYIGFTHKTEKSYIAVGMDHSIKQNLTYLIRPNGTSDLLGELSADYSGYNMMMRAQVAIQNSGMAYFYSGILQDPLLKANADFILVSESPMEKATLEAWHIINQDTTDLTMVPVDNANRVFSASNFNLNVSGTHKIRVSGNYIGSDIVADTIMTFTVSYYRTDESSLLTSPDHSIRIILPEGSFRENGSFILKDGLNTFSLTDLAFEHSLVEKSYKQFALIFDEQNLTSPVKIEIQTPQPNSVLGLLTEHGVELIPTTYENSRITAEISKSGEYVVMNNSETETFANQISKFQLYQNYPNPFNPKTIIRVDVPKNGNFELAIYNILGQKIRTLYQSAITAGHYRFQWDGRDDNGHIVANGIYIYQVRFNGETHSRKMIFLK